MTNQDREQLIARAAQLGLGRLAAEHPADLAKAAAAAERIIAGLVRPVGWADEPAHVYRADPGSAAP